jgi:23S rRNA (uracil1939-C5)-methyltransferase
MKELTLKLTGMAHGGFAMGRDKNGRPVFVPYAIPGERVRVRLPEENRRFARVELVGVIDSAPDRVSPRCRHFGVCGNCHFQHMNYQAQLQAKEAVVRDQLVRVGGIKNPSLRPIVAFPSDYEYRIETTLFPATGGGLGYWSPTERHIFPVEECPILRPGLMAALADLDVDLPGLRKLTLRLGDENELLAALETDDVEPPELAVDFPVSVAIVLPDRTAAALIGDPYLVVTIKNRPYRVSPGVGFPPSAIAAEMVIDAVLDAAEVRSDARIILVPGGAGWLAAALAGQAAEVVMIEPNPDAVADAVENLDEFDNVSIYEGAGQDILALLEDTADSIIFQGAEDAVPPDALNWLSRRRPRQVIVIAEIGVLAKAAGRLSKTGYRLKTAIPLDTHPQAFQVEVVAVWEVAGQDI